MHISICRFVNCRGDCSCKQGNSLDRPHIIDMASGSLSSTQYLESGMARFLTPFCYGGRFVVNESHFESARSKDLSINYFILFFNRSKRQA